MFQAWLHWLFLCLCLSLTLLFPCAWHKRMGPPGSSEMDQGIHVWALQSTGAKVSLNVRSHSITPIPSYKVKREKRLCMATSHKASCVRSFALTPCRNWLPFFLLSPLEEMEVSFVFLNLPWILSSCLLLQVTNVADFFFFLQRELLGLILIIFPFKWLRTS